MGHLENIKAVKLAYDRLTTANMELQDAINNVNELPEIGDNATIKEMMEYPELLDYTQPHIVMNLYKFIRNTLYTIKYPTVTNNIELYIRDYITNCIEETYHRAVDNLDLKSIELIINYYYKHKHLFNKCSTDLRTRIAGMEFRLVTNLHDIKYLDVNHLSEYNPFVLEAIVNVARHEVRTNVQTHFYAYVSTLNKIVKHLDMSETFEEQNTTLKWNVNLDTDLTEYTVEQLEELVTEHHKQFNGTPVIAETEEYRKLVFEYMLHRALDKGDFMNYVQENFMSSTVAEAKIIIIIHIHSQLTLKHSAPELIQMQHILTQISPLLS